MKKQFIKPNGWKPEEDKYLIENYGKHSNKQISLVINRTETAILLRAKILGIWKRKRKPKRYGENYKGGKYITGTEIASIRNNAKVRNIPFFINMNQNEIIEYIEKIYIEQNKKCALTGLLVKFNTTMSVGNGKILLGDASIDRINCNTGYEKGNIQIIHKDINIMKGELEKERFFELCELITNHKDL